MSYDTVGILDPKHSNLTLSFTFGGRVAPTWHGPVDPPFVLPCSIFSRDNLDPPGNEAFEQRSWLSVPAGGTISMATATGCEVFVKEGEWRPSTAHA